MSYVLHMTLHVLRLVSSSNRTSTDQTKKILVDAIQHHLYNILFNVCTQIFSVIEKLKDIWGDSYGNTRFSYWLWDSEKAYFSNWKWCRPCNRIQPTVTQANCCLSLNPKLLRFYFKVKFVFQKIGNTVTCKKDFSGMYAQFLHNVFQRIHNGSQFLLINNFFGGVLYKLQYC